MAGAALEEHLAAACRIARQRRAVSGGHGRGRGDGWRCSMGVADCAGDERGDDKSEHHGFALLVRLCAVRRGDRCVADPKSGVEAKRVSVSFGSGGARFIKKKKTYISD